MYFILNVCYIPFIPLSSKSSTFFQIFRGRNEFLPLSSTRPEESHFFRKKLNPDYKSTRAVRKNRYNNTPVVDGIHGNSEIANVFKSKFSVPYISVSTTTEAMESVFATTVQIMRMKQMVIHIVMLLKEIMLNQPLTS